MIQVILLVALLAQQPAPAAPQAPPSARAAAQVDITGNWVAVVTEEWRWRMMTPPKGDYPNVPMNAEGKKIADSWDLAKDNAAGLQCKAFGAGAIMRLPLRIRVSWADDNTLKVETDAGQQTRLLNFDKTKQPGAERSWQGFTTAEWTRPLPPPQRGGRGRGAAPEGPIKGSLKIVTKNLRPGYLRKNGVPYSENAVVTEYFDRVSGFGTDYLIVTTIVEDPMYLTGPFMTTSHFMREADGSRFKPSPCKTDPPARTAPPTANGD
jgi:hypothetical protein